MAHWVCRGVEVQQSDGFPWNGWVAQLDPEGRPIEPYSFEISSWWEFFSHLVDCKICRRKNGLTKRQVTMTLRKLRREWDLVFG